MNRYFFLHIPKTAGTTLFKVFRDLFGAEMVLSFGAEFDQLDLTRLAPYVVIGGHVSFKDMSLFGSRRHLTFLRHPVDHILSLYHYRRNLPAREHDHKIKLSKEFTLTEILRSAAGHRTKFYFNQATWQLAGLGNAAYAADEEDVLEIAKAHLSQLDFVGIFEDMPGSLALMSDTFGWPSIQSLPRENITNGRISLGELSEDDRNRILELSHLDLQLYEFALSMFKERRSQSATDLREANRNLIPVGASFRCDSTGKLMPKCRMAEQRVQNLDSVGTHGVRIIHAELVGRVSKSNRITCGESCVYRALMWSDEDLQDVVISIRVVNRFGQIMFGCRSTAHGLRLSVRQRNLYGFECQMSVPLAPGEYKVAMAAFKGLGDPEIIYDLVDTSTTFLVEGYSQRPFRGVVDLAPDITLLDSCSDMEIMPYDLSDVVDFCESGNARKYLLSGWSFPEAWGCWTDGTEARLLARLSSPPRHDLCLAAKFHAFCPRPNPPLKTEVLVNGSLLATWHFTTEDPHDLRLQVPKQLLANSLLYLVFQIHDPEQPIRVGRGPDERRLGLGFQQLSIS